MKAKLIELDSEQAAEIQFDEFPVYIGRSPELQWSIQDRWVSRKHCVIEHSSDGRLVVRDLGSKHGTFVNSHRISEAELSVGDKLSIGMCTFFVSFEQQPAVELKAAAG